ncbi:YheC/YheD family endospore coat-associated protein [Desertibacillus haloalkaliphilus]|uniref:YheC/YheD family endospore coat-associated protein n=1 Tax=Desertibacillus haloalkaliphilus TaxID=1328930 RepID=UPI001C2786DC|nr:YheC/YheD family protein [Desertibacillus haloalkaliphilus]MBU8905428.1 YheC/YheD family protein [Desertibacillus haloalkaliphilus]
MLSLGILVLHVSQELTYFREIANRASDYNITVYRFLPSQVDRTTARVINGLRYDPNEDRWVTTTFPIPTYIYDRCFYRRISCYKKHAPIIRWLRDHYETTFLGYGLPNKWEVFKALNKNKVISNYLPETVKVEHVSDIIKHVKHYKEVLVKPTSGSQGQGIFVVTEKPTHYEVKIEKNQLLVVHCFINEVKLAESISLLLHSQRYILQPFLSLKNQQNHPFDLRVFLQKDKNGFWCEQGRAVRTGKKAHFLSNLHAGGQIYPYQQWLQHLSEEKQQQLESNIHQLLEHLPSSLESSFHPLFELGIDIGIDQSESVWLLEVNSKPGRTILLEDDSFNKDQLYEAPLAFCQHLSSLIKRS